jgi:hypothetical protein
MFCSAAASTSGRVSHTICNRTFPTEKDRRGTSSLDARAYSFSRRSDGSSKSSSSSFVRKSNERKRYLSTNFSASASGFFSAANNEVNNVKKLDQSIKLYEKLEREIRTSDWKSLSLSDCVIKLALNEPSVTLRDRVMVSLCAEAMSIIPECGLENASLVISLALKHALIENGIDLSTIEVKVGYVKSIRNKRVRCDAHVWLEVDHRIIDLSVDGVQIVEMARKAGVPYEDVEKMAKHFSMDLAKEINKDIRPATVLGVPIVLNECVLHGLMLKEPPLTVEGAANAIETARKYEHAVQNLTIKDIAQNLENNNNADLKSSFLRLSSIQIERVISAKNKFIAFEDAAEKMDKALQRIERVNARKIGPR